MLEKGREGRVLRMEEVGDEGERVLLAWRVGRAGRENEGRRNRRNSGSAIMGK